MIKNQSTLINPVAAFHNFMHFPLPLFDMQLFIIITSILLLIIAERSSKNIIASFILIRASQKTRKEMKIFIFLPPSVVFFIQMPFELFTPLKKPATLTNMLAKGLRGCNSR